MCFYDSVSYLDGGAVLAVFLTLVGGYDTFSPVRFILVFWSVNNAKPISELIRGETDAKGNMGARDVKEIDLRVIHRSQLGRRF